MKDKNAILDFDFGEDGDEETGKEDLGAKEPQIEQFLANVLKARNLAIFNPCDLHGSLKIITFRVEADKDYAEGTTFALCRFPQSQIRILGALSRIDYKLSCKTAKLGWSKFKQRNMQIIETDLSGFGKVTKVKGTGSFLEHLPTQTVSVDSLEGIFLLCLTGSPGKKGDIIEGYLIYVKQ